MSEHDPIREWHAQKERAEFLGQICGEVARGGNPDVAAAVLSVAGIEAELVAEAIEGAMVERRRAERTDQDVDQAAQILHEAREILAGTEHWERARDWLDRYETRSAQQTYVGHPVEVSHGG